MNERAEILKFAGILIGAGLLYGLLRGDGLIIGACAGILLVGSLFAVGWLGGLGDRH
jgi:hypothetical protein